MLVCIRPMESFMSTKVGIVGSGIVGQTLANGFVKHGYDVMIGTNTASKREELKSKTNGKAKIGTFEDAAKFGEIVVLATKGTAAEAALKLAGIANLKGKTVIDTMNPIADATPVNGVLQVLHLAKRIAHGEASGARRRGSFCEVIQLHRQRVHGQRRLQRRQADDVHLRQS